MKRTKTSKQWMMEHINDVYVQRAKAEGYRSRAAYKLIEVVERDKLLKPGMVVVDLGAAPGGWSQLAALRVRAGAPGGGRVIAVDLSPMDPLPGVDILTLDFLDEAAAPRIRAALQGAAELVLSDMAPPATGHAATDHLRIMALAEAALDFAEEVLAPGGAFVAKVWQGGSERGLLERLRRGFAKVRHLKPASSRAESAELFVVATGFRGVEGKQEEAEG